jgi:hypothetical protein
VDVTAAGTTTLDYWAVIPSSQHVFHATRDVVIEAATNDNTATTSAATSTATN